jgi:hypothetical protein
VAASRTRQTRRYEIVLRGELSDRFQSAFDDVKLRRVEGNTVLVSVVDQSHLHALLARIQELGLILLSVKPCDSPD